MVYHMTKLSTESSSPKKVFESLKINGFVIYLFKMPNPSNLQRYITKTIKMVLFILLNFKHERLYFSYNSTRYIPSQK